ncbi:MAG: glycosyltransferase family 4 protein [Acidimicrobiales bacterium]
MRVAQVCPYSLTLPGGVQSQVLGLARVLRELGHEARVLGPCDGPPPAPWVTSLGASIPTAANGSVAPIAPDPSAALRTMRALRDEGFDIVHCHEPMVPGPTLTSLLVADAPKVGTFHRAGASSAYERLRPAARWAARKLDLRCAVSADAAATAQAALGGEYEIVFNGIEVSRFAKAQPTVPDGPTILFLGRHEPRKGLSVLLDAMALLPADVRLWVASDGPQTEALRARTAGDPRISWLGRISDDERASRLRGADVFCAPSLGGESFGVVLLEAMAAQVPVVASDLPGYRAVARPALDAQLVPPGDASALAAALLRVLRDRDFAAQLVASGEQRAACFAMERLAERYLELYDRLL